MVKNQKILGKIRKNKKNTQKYFPFNKLFVTLKNVSNIRYMTCVYILLTTMVESTIQDIHSAKVDRRIFEIGSNTMLSVFGRLLEVYKILKPFLSEKFKTRAQKIQKQMVILQSAVVSPYLCHGSLFLIQLLLNNWPNLG